MTAPQQGPFRRFFGGLFRAVDFSRRLAMNAIFLIVMLIVLVALFSGGHGALEQKTTLVLNLQGAIVEQYTAAPLDRALGESLGDPVKETRLRDITQALQAAATDAHITQVLLITHGIAGIGPASTRELAAALRTFRKSGKKLYAYADGYEQRGYLLAAQADEVLLHPQGAVLLEGLGRYRTYFKDAFDKFGIEAHLFRVGEYKSAGEPYIRADSSPEADEADLYWMNDVWSRHLADIAEARKLDVATLKAQIDDYPNQLHAAHGDLAQLAKSQGLVDALVTRDELEARIAASGAPGDDARSFRQIGFLDYVQRANAVPQMPGRSAVAIVVAEGEIVDGDGGPGNIGGESTSALLRDAREADDVKAVVLRVNSPGGSVFPSELIRREVELIQAAGKPVVVSMGDLAASGGYWISMDADRIYADPSTITGSIGIFGLFFNVPEAMRNVGLNTDGVGTTWLAGAFDPARPLDPKVGAMIQDVLDAGYRDFTSKVAAARKQDVAAIDAIARGRVWSGAQAKQHGLVDAFGGLEAAVADAAERAKLGTDHVTRYIEKPPSLFESFMIEASRSGATALLREHGLLTPLSFLREPAKTDLARLQRLMHARPGSGLPIAIQAHCECGVR
ncbi:MAG: signal peptide peptidase SppA [Rhodanobacteraceae bacterium]|nr:signal peptide peptidase SppA [Rhodanobacteraceae bacterium]MBP9154199.1 signal peptide peptidase SppA [Xanthomonadales bacterium]HQW81650.1 signal peptide peptidase SppA [Pseudomonadota bacterium]